MCSDSLDFTRSSRVSLYTKEANWKEKKKKKLPGGYFVLMSFGAHCFLGEGRRVCEGSWPRAPGAGVAAPITDGARGAGTSRKHRFG